MGYEYDIFISYRRQDETKGWIENHFIPLLEIHIFNELGEHPSFFLDTQLEAGVNWPIELGNKLSKSKTIIPLWTRTYLNSQWCSCEIGHMLERESQCGYRTIEKPNGLVFPTIIHDGETMPVQLSTIQKVEIQDCFNVRMAKDSPKAEKLEDRLKPLAISISKAIANVPEWKPDWNIEAVNDFVQQYHLATRAVQETLPKHLE
ncbi:TIR domain-containing protein [Flagellimonas sp. 2504JD4-2]